MDSVARRLTVITAGRPLLPPMKRDTVRIRFAAITLLLALLAAGLLPSPAGAQTAPSTATTSSLIVKLVAGLTVDQQASVVARNGGTVVSSIPALRLLVVSTTAEDVAVALARYQADPQVESAEQNRVRLSESVPSDPLYLNQWALPIIGWEQVFGVVGPAGTARVAVLDTGVDAQHPELAGVVIPGTSILDGSDGMTDPSGHGTWLAGIIAARTNGSPLEGIAGVAYAGVEIMPVTVLNGNGEGMDSDVIAGVIWAADHGANVILMAFSNQGFSSSLQDAIDYAWSRGAVIVASAGNNASSEPHFPAGDRGVMGVAATDTADGLASFSNNGPAVFIAAPGVDIQTVDIGAAYTVISGTSAAAAHVAGLAALMKAVDPSLPNGVIVFRIASTADPAGAQSDTGNGRINMPRALASTATDSIQPAGAAPMGGGGPFVGPYTGDNHTLLLSCSPSSVNVSIATSCTAELNRPGSGGLSASGRPITFTGGTGTFSSNSCVTSGNDATASCSVQFTPTSSGSHVLTASVTFATGGGGHSTSTNFTVTATPGNTPPAIAADSQSVTAAEGATATNTGTWSDANASDTVTLTASVGTVVKSGANAAGTWSWSFAASDGLDQSQTVTITANDGQGGVTTTTFGLTVNNVAPTVALTGPTTANQGDTVTYTFTVSDPGQDAFVTKPGFPTCGAGGTSSALSTSSTGGSFQCTFASGPATRTVSIQVTDSDGADSNVSSVTVAVNAPPRVELLGDTTADEGQTKTYSYTVTDPGDTFTVKPGFPTCGSDGTLGTMTTDSTGGTFQCTFPDGPGSSVVSIQVTDSGGLDSNAPAISVTVNNVPPTVLLAGAATADEGQTKLYSFTVSDPGVDSFTVTAGFPDCGTGGTVVGGSLSTDAGGGSFQCSFPDGPASPMVRVQVTDSDGADSNVGSIPVTVSNVPPAVLLTGATTASEGETKLYTFTVSDPGVDTFSVAAGFPDCGTGGTLVAGSLSTNTGGGTFQCTFPDGPASPVVQLQVADSDGATSNIAAVTVDVANVSPTITNVSGPPAPVAVETPVSLIVTFSDPGVDGHTCEFDWDDATPDTDATVGETTGTGSCSASHIYLAAGVYTVVVTVTDTDDASSAPARYEYIVVYDPSAGFVTGGGWIVSPAGAYRPDTSLTGKATFGFVSKYKKGAAVPTGETEFQFHAAGFNFHSDTYQYLVIAGAKAQYKGDGKVNGAGSYGFLLTATDGQRNGGGGVDKFRIKIWDKDNGDALVYDNVLDGSDTEDIDYVNTQAIGGGSIVIHSGK